MWLEPPSEEVRVRGCILRRANFFLKTQSETIFGGEPNKHDYGIGVKVQFSFLAEYQARAIEHLILYCLGI
jgi:hypothetical protein